MPRLNQDLNHALAFSIFLMLHRPIALCTRLQAATVSEANQQSGAHHVVHDLLLNRGQHFDNL
jgi:hypothetical protein